MGYSAITLRRRAGKRRRKGAGNPCRENGRTLISQLRKKRCTQNEHIVFHNACHPVSAARLSSEVSQNAVRLNLEPTNNIYLHGGRRVRGFMDIEALVHPAA
jgi:hypothetical protein